MNPSLTLKRVPSLSILRDIVQIIFCTGLLGLSAQAAMTLPFTPVPVTFQTVILFLIAACLGPQKATLTMIAYLAEGFLGLPVFSKGGSSILWLIGPTGGYLVGFILAAFISGYFFQKEAHKSFLKSSLAFGMGSLVILTSGSLWLANFMDLKSAIIVGFIPFLFAEFIKILMAASLVPFFKK